MARVYAIAWAVLLGSTLVSPLLLLAAVAWPTCELGYRAGSRVASLQVSRRANVAHQGGVG